MSGRDSPRRWSRNEYSVHLAEASREQDLHKRGRPQISKYLVVPPFHRPARCRMVRRDVEFSPRTRRIVDHRRLEAGVPRQHGEGAGCEEPSGASAHARLVLDRPKGAAYSPSQRLRPFGISEEAPSLRIRSCRIGGPVIGFHQRPTVSGRTRRRCDFVSLDGRDVVCALTGKSEEEIVIQEIGPDRRECLGAMRLHRHASGSR